MKRTLCIFLAFVFCIICFTGCDGFDEDETSHLKENNIQLISLSINEAKNPVFISIDNCAEMAGKRDMVHATKITSNENGKIAECISCSDFGSAFWGTYHARGEHLERATVNFDINKQKYASVTCGVNYYDSIMHGEVWDCDRISITYDKGIKLKGVTGDFSFFVFSFDEESTMQFGQSIITVSGTVEETSNVSLTWNGKTFTLESDKIITNCKAVTEIAERTEEFVYEAKTSGNVYDISVIDGKPVIKDKNL